MTLYTGMLGIEETNHAALIYLVILVVFGVSMHYSRVKTSAFVDIITAISSSPFPTTDLQT